MQKICWNKGTRRGTQTLLAFSQILYATISPSLMVIFKGLIVERYDLTKIDFVHCLCCGCTLVIPTQQEDMER